MADKPLAFETTVEVGVLSFFSLLATKSGVDVVGLLEEETAVGGSDGGSSEEGDPADPGRTILIGGTFFCSPSSTGVIDTSAFSVTVF